MKQPPHPHLHPPTPRAVIDNDAAVLANPKHVQKECELLTSAAGLTAEFLAEPKMKEGRAPA